MFTVANLVLNQSSPKPTHTNPPTTQPDQSINDDRSESMDDDCESMVSRPSEELEDAMIKSIMESGKRIDIEPYVRRRNGTKCLKNRKKVSEPEMQELRLRINSRERKRMHDLNSALDSLRQVMPFSHGPSVRKLSKISTLLMARSYILALNQSVEELRGLLNAQKAKDPKVVSPSPPTSKASERNSNGFKPAAAVQPSNIGQMGPITFTSAPTIGPFFPFPPLLAPTAFFPAAMVSRPQIG